jgi:hypothetical protein
MELKSIIKRIISRNPWLSDPLTDYGELFAEVVECENVEELYNMVKSYAGAFKYKNMLFFNSYHYGVFVYDIRKPDNYIEHLTIDYMTFEHFASLINKLLER